MTAQRLPHDVQRALEAAQAALRQAGQTSDAARRMPMLRAACSGIKDIAVYLSLGDGTQLIELFSTVARLGGGAPAFDTWREVRDVGDASAAAGSLLGILREMLPDQALAERALAEARSFWFDAMRPALIMACGTSHQTSRRRWSTRPSRWPDPTKRRRSRPPCWPRRCRMFLRPTSRVWPHWRPHCLRKRCCRMIFGGSWKR